MTYWTVSSCAQYDSERDSWRKESKSSKRKQGCIQEKYIETGRSREQLWPAKNKKKRAGGGEMKDRQALISTGPAYKHRV
jgi:hypothetical protein